MEVSHSVSDRRLHLLRHAKSSWDDAWLSDHERPLAPRGERAGRAMAKHMGAEGTAPELVLCSDAVRATQTLDLIREALGESRIEVEAELYGASAGDLLGRVQQVDDGTSSVMLIGHNPGMHDVALQLAGGGRRLDDLRVEYPTCALVTLEF